MRSDGALDKATPGRKVCYRLSHLSTPPHENVGHISRLSSARLYMWPEVIPGLINSERVGE